MGGVFLTSVGWKSKITGCVARVAELVDAHGSGPCAARCGGSSPFPGTTLTLPRVSPVEGDVTAAPDRVDGRGQRPHLGALGMIPCPSPAVAATRRCGRCGRSWVVGNDMHFAQSAGRAAIVAVSPPPPRTRVQRRLPREGTLGGRHRGQRRQQVLVQARYYGVFLCAPIRGDARNAWDGLHPPRARGRRSRTSRAHISRCWTVRAGRGGRSRWPRARGSHCRRDEIALRGMRCRTKPTGRTSLH